MENYEQKYEQALERAKSIYNADKITGLEVRTCEQIFPELKESEDERIRKALIRNFTNQHSSKFPTADGLTREQILAWLEKQGEKKPTDEVEPKFKVGNWVVSPNGVYWHIDTIRNDRYQVSSNLGNSADWPLNTNIYHKFTIQDAKDGDVLATKKGNPFIYDKYRYNNGLAYYYAGLDVNKELTLKSPYTMLTHFGKLCSVSPATKEQRDLLFQMIKEAGYEWDAEKKELKKIEQKPAEWSEEDEKMCSQVINEIEAIKSNSSTIFEKNIAQDKIDWLKSLKDRVQPQPKQEWSEEDEKIINDAIWLIEHYATDGHKKLLREQTIDKLKSLKPNHWKPSEQNIKDLEWCADLVKDKMGVGFHRLQVFIDELKKL